MTNLDNMDLNHSNSLSSVKYELDGRILIQDAENGSTAQAFNKNSIANILTIASFGFLFTFFLPSIILILWVYVLYNIT